MKNGNARSYCKVCDKEKAKQWNKDNPNKKKKIRIDYYYRNRDKILKQQYEYYLKNKEKIVERERENTDCKRGSGAGKNNGK